jgi:hypothetical protein
LVVQSEQEQAIEPDELAASAFRHGTVKPVHRLLNT